MPASLSMLIYALWITWSCVHAIRFEWMKEYGTKCGGSVSARQTFTSRDFECSNEPPNRSDKKRKCQIHHRLRAKLKDKILSPMMQGIGSPTGPILSARNKAVNWKVLKQQWENYSIVAQLERQREEYRVALFLYSIGPAAVKIYNSFDLSEANRCPSGFGPP